MSIAGHLAGVTEDRYGSTLTADLTVGDTVLEVDSTTDFDEEAGGSVLINGTKLDYVAFDDPDEDDSDDDGPTTLTLAVASTIAADAGDRVWAYDPTTGEDDPVTEVIALVTIDDRDDGDALPARVRAGLVEQLDSDFETYLGKAVELEVTDQGELILVDILGSKRTGSIRFKATDTHTVTFVGDQVFALTHRPIAESEHLRWNGASQAYTDFTRDGSRVTVADPDNVLQVGDVLTMQYAYQEPTSSALLFIPLGTPWKYATGLGSSTTYSDPAFDDSAWASAATPVQAPLYPSPGNVWQRITATSAGGDLTFTMTKTDNTTKVYLDGVLVFSATSWSATVATVTVAAASGSHVIAVYSADTDGPTGAGEGTGIAVEEN